MKNNIKFQGAPLTLVGRPLSVGSFAPKFEAVYHDMKKASLADFTGKVKVITTFPSLDTPVCNLQVKEFNKNAVNLSENVIVLGISNDLPFAQERFCQVNSIDKVIVLSDYKGSSFGFNYGLFIKELKLLARAVLIVDTNDMVRYIQIVDEITNQPDYQSVLTALEQVLSNPVAEANKSAGCKPCEAGQGALSPDESAKRIKDLTGWELIEGKKLKKKFKFSGFSDATCFADCIFSIAEEQRHHPVLTVGYNSVNVTLSTHAVCGLSNNDFIMAKIVDEVMI